MGAAEAKLTVEIWGDLVCPWCYLGNARFAKALAAFAHADRVEVRYRSFELNPAHPKGETEDVLEMLAGRYGLSPAEAAAAERRVADLAGAEGLPFSVERRHGNTFDAHRLTHLAADRGRQAEVVDALYRANFGGQRSIFEPESLAAVAVDAGLDPAETRDVLAGDAYADAVRADEGQAAAHGVRGVPFFVLAGTFAVSGGQPAEVFADALNQAWDKVTV